MSPFSHSTTGDEVTRHFASRIRGKTVLITGASPSTIGSETAYSLALSSPAHILLAGRSRSNIEPVVSKLHDLNPDVKVTFVHLELASLSSVRAAVQNVEAELGAKGKLDVLINNAGIIPGVDRSLTDDGFESAFGVNHLGHFVLTKGLMDRLVGGGRVINVTSTAFVGQGIKWDDVNFEKSTYDLWYAYGQSKTANNLFSIGLVQRYREQGLTSFAVHPGTSNETQLTKHIPQSEFTRAWARFKKKVDAGEPTLHPGPPKTLQQMSATTLVAAFDDELEASNGAFLMDCSVYEDVIPHASDPKEAEMLWALSERMVGDK